MMYVHVVIALAITTWSVHTIECTLTESIYTYVYMCRICWVKEKSNETRERNLHISEHKVVL